MCDLETTVYEGQEKTEAWASGISELFMGDQVYIHTCLYDTYQFVVNLCTDCVLYYHNLKFDGEFWLSFLLTELKLKQAFDQVNEKVVEKIAKKDMEDGTFMYQISDMGQWYGITIKINGNYIEFRDSFKLLPFSVERIGKAFSTKRRKTEIEYVGIRKAKGVISEKEKEYIANDILVVKEALEMMIKEGHNKMTIGSCCLSEFRNFFDEEDYNKFFPNLYDVPLDENLYRYDNVGEYIRRSYKGGWCYKVPECKDIVSNGVTLDVNSLYPSMMSSDSGNYYPIGKPHFWKGNVIPPEALQVERYYFVRVLCKFKIKKNKLPCIQIKNNLLYNGREWLTTSDIYSKKTGKYHEYITGIDGTIVDSKVLLTLTMTDYNLIIDHYDFTYFEILDGCWFYSAIGLFDQYIDKYKKIKQESTGAKRELAKLFLNNLYGKMASNTKSSFKYAYVKEDGSIGYTIMSEDEKEPGYIPIGSAITSYARNFTIRAAQLNYYGKGNRGFKYADTDSLHCDLDISEVKGVNLHDTEFCCWKHESNWDIAYFVRAKTYVERVTHEHTKNGFDNVEPYYCIKCAGMPERCKQLLLDSILERKREGIKYNKEELNFIKRKREITDFNIGLIVPSKLMPKRIKGGIVLTETTFEMR